MKLVPLTQGKFAKVDDEDFEWLMALGKWQYDDGYAKRRGISPQRRKMSMHREIMNNPPNKEIDHIDRDGLNNQKYNLRICTHNENMFNQTSQSRNTSGYKGVTWDKNNNKWHAQIMVSQKQKHLGLFVNKEDAARAYDEAAIKYHKTFARLNFEHE